MGWAPAEIVPVTDGSGTAVVKSNGERATLNVGHVTAINPSVG